MKQYHNRPPPDAVAYHCFRDPWQTPDVIRLGLSDAPGYAMRDALQEADCPDGLLYALVAIPCCAAIQCVWLEPQPYRYRAWCWVGDEDYRFVVPPYEVAPSTVDIETVMNWITSHLTDMPRNSLTIPAISEPR